MNIPPNLDSINEKSDLVYMAQVAEQAERYEEMVSYMRKAAEMGDMSVEERNLFSVAYKNVVGSRRASWRVLSSIEANVSDSSKTEIVKGYKNMIEDELKSTCTEVIEIVERYGFTTEGESESQVFFQKMKGDYYRYQAEFLIAEARDQITSEAVAAYKSATEVAEQLASTNPIRLGLALNYSVFYYEILGQAERACELAKSAFDDAIAELDTLSEDSYKDATLIMQLLRDNLTLWTSDQNEGEHEGKQ
jgi:14-3-3 protein epsilon